MKWEEVPVLVAYFLGLFWFLLFMHFVNSKQNNNKTTTTTKHPLGNVWFAMIPSSASWAENRSLSFCLHYFEPTLLLTLETITLLIPADINYLFAATFLLLTLFFSRSGQCGLTLGKWYGFWWLCQSVILTHTMFGFFPLMLWFSFLLEHRTYGLHAWMFAFFLGNVVDYTTYTALVGLLIN